MFLFDDVLVDGKFVEVVGFLVIEGGLSHISVKNKFKLLSNN